jgi:hypothetical protein
MNQLDFLESMRYIGCSRPACYLCHKHITSHPADLVHPKLNLQAFQFLLPSSVHRDDHPTIWQGMQDKIERDLLDCLYQCAKMKRERKALA